MKHVNWLPTLLFAAGAVWGVLVAEAVDQGWSPWPWRVSGFVFGVLLGMLGGKLERSRG